MDFNSSTFMPVIYIVSATALLVFVWSGCSRQTGYIGSEGNWQFVERAGIGDKPVSRQINVDASTFQVLANSQYAKDESTVFFQGRTVEGAHCETFDVFDADGYAFDKDQVYLYKYVIHGADPETFQPLSFPFGKDKANVFCGTVRMNVDDISRFEVEVPSSMIHTASAESAILGDLAGYRGDLKRDSVVVYGTSCRSRSGVQRFIGPVLQHDNGSDED